MNGNRKPSPLALIPQHTLLSLSSLFLMQSLGYAAVCPFFPFFFFLKPACFRKQITPSEPGGACPSRWRRRWNVTQTADWQGGTHWEKQDEVEDGQARGGDRTEWGGRGGEDKKRKDTWTRKQEWERLETGWSERRERRRKKSGSPFLWSVPWVGQYQVNLGG